MGTDNNSYKYLKVWTKTTLQTKIGELSPHLLYSTKTWTMFNHAEKSLISTAQVLKQRAKYMEFKYRGEIIRAACKTVAGEIIRAVTGK